MGKSGKPKLRLHVQKASPESDTTLHTQVEPPEVEIIYDTLQEAYVSEQVSPNIYAYAFSFDPDDPIPHREPDPTDPEFVELPADEDDMPTGSGNDEELFRQIWRPLLHAEKEGLPLDDASTSAVQLRDATLQVVRSLDDLLFNPNAASDIMTQAQLTASYYDGIAQLQRLGISADMTFEDENSRAPLHVAETTAQQMLLYDRDYLPSNVKHALLQIKEFSTESGTVEIGNQLLTTSTGRMEDLSEEALS